MRSSRRTTHKLFFIWRMKPAYGAKANGRNRAEFAGGPELARSSQLGLLFKGALLARC
jgi:hypothetical protein